MKKFLSAFAISAMLPFLSIAQTTVTLSPIQDAVVGHNDGFNTGNDNYSTDIKNAASITPSTNGQGVNVSRALLQFDLTGIPQGATITSAKLNLYATGPFGPVNGHFGTANQCYLQRVTAPWVNNTVTWNNQPATTAQNEVTLAQSTSPTQDYLDIDVLDLVTDMIANSNNGFMLKLINETVSNGLLFCSIDHSNQAKHPTLEVTYVYNCATIKPTADAVVGHNDGFNTGNDNYSTDIKNAASITPSTNGQGVNVSRAIMLFDLSVIPQNTTLTSAKLNLYATGPFGPVNGHFGTANTCYLQRITEPWAENTVTWNNQPATTTQNEATLAQSTTPTQNYLNIDVLALVNDMIANGNNGFMLILANESVSNGLLFCSIDHTDTTKHPVLELCWEVKTGVEAFTAKTETVTIYPNPAHGLFNIKTEDGNGKKTIEIHTSDGKLLKSITTSTIYTMVDMSGYSTGVYFIKVLSDKGTVTKKLVLTGTN